MDWKKFVKSIIFVIALILAILLYLNRFGFTLFDNSHEVSYCERCELRHLFEHLSFGTLLLILSPLIILIKDLANQEHREILKNFLIILLGAFIVCIGIYRIYELNNFLQSLRFIYDLIGLLLSFLYIRYE